MARASSKSCITAFTPLTRSATCRYASISPPTRIQHQSTRALSTSAAAQIENFNYPLRQPRYPQDQPRWAQTPPLMQAPFRTKPPPKHDNEFTVNEDPVRLDTAYERVLGKGGSKMLSEEVKWMAVTHKSFDHGRRGYNDRLAFLGKQIVELHSSLALINGSSVTPLPVPADHYDREPFRHPALNGLDGLTRESKQASSDTVRLARLGENYGLGKVLRWKPKMAKNLQASGLPFVLSQALYAIIGAVALQRGGEVAKDIAKERIIEPLGLH